MTLYQSDPINILAGKVPYVPHWNLSIDVTPVLIVNNEIVDISNLDDYPEIHSLESIQIQVMYDDRLLINDNILRPILFNTKIQDSEDAQEHCLRMCITGKTDDHSCLSAGNPVSVAAAVNIYIEDLSVNLALNAINVSISGKDLLLLGENNKEVCAKLKTPIYHWLIDHNWTILNQIKHK